MIVAYVDSSDAVVCSNCWTERAASGEGPSKVLDTEDPDDPGDNFWLVDVCAKCRREIKYKDARLLA